MTRVEAVYENGVLRPLQPVELQEQDHVVVTIEKGQESFRRLSWDEVAAHREEMRRQFGVLPDSTPEIAEDRRRDV